MGVYKEITEEFYKLYKDFIDSGFSEEQAITLFTYIAIINVLSIYNEGSCELGYMDNYDMQDFYGWSIFKSCNIKNDPRVRIVKNLA